MVVLLVAPVSSIISIALNSSNGAGPSESVDFTVSQPPLAEMAPQDKTGAGTAVGAGSAGYAFLSGPAGVSNNFNRDSLIHWDSTASADAITSPGAREVIPEDQLPITSSSSGSNELSAGILSAEAPAINDRNDPAAASAIPAASATSADPGVISSISAASNNIAPTQVSSVVVSEVKPADDTAPAVTSNGTGAPADSAAPQLIASSTGLYIWPTNGVITSCFGHRTTTVGSTNHLGIDIGGISGQPISAAYGGEVIFAGWSNSYGNMVRIKHGNGDETVYGHCRSLLVSTGDTVTQGQEIATMGKTGVASGVHLHFELLIDGENVDPALYLPVVQSK